MEKHSGWVLSACGALVLVSFFLPEAKESLHSVRDRFSKTSFESIPVELEINQRKKRLKKLELQERQKKLENPKAQIALHQGNFYTYQNQRSCEMILYQPQRILRIQRLPERSIQTDSQRVFTCDNRKALNRCASLDTVIRRDLRRSCGSLRKE